MTQPIDNQTLDRVAQLAQLSLPDEQKPSLKQAMNDVLDLVASLQDVATDDVEPMAHPLSCLLYTSPSPRDQRGSRMPSSA